MIGGVEAGAMGEKEMTGAGVLAEGEMKGVEAEVMTERKVTGKEKMKTSKLFN